MKQISKVIDWIEDWLIFVLMVVMPIVIVCQVFLRVTNQPLRWTEETARYLFIWVIYLGCSRSVRMKSELSVDAVQNMLRDGTRARAVFDLVAAVLCVIFAAVFVRYSIALIINMVKFPKYSPACHYNMIIVYLSSVVGSILMLARYAYRAIQKIGLVIHPQKLEASNEEATE